MALNSVLFVRTHIDAFDNEIISKAYGIKGLNLFQTQSNMVD